MKLSLVAVLAMAAMATSRSIKNKNQVTMERLMGLKVASREKLRDDGYFGAGKWKSSSEVQTCTGGKAGEYGCDKVDLYSFASHEDLGSETKEGNDLWGMFSNNISFVGSLTEKNCLQAGHHLMAASLVLLASRTELLLWRLLRTARSSI